MDHLRNNSDCSDDSGASDHSADRPINFKRESVKYHIIVLHSQKAVSNVRIILK